MNAKGMLSLPQRTPHENNLQLCKNNIIYEESVLGTEKNRTELIHTPKILLYTKPKDVNHVII
jgi:hypothetical protein